MRETINDSIAEKRYTDRRSDPTELHYYPICPYSRLIRLMLHEKGVDYVPKPYFSYKMPPNLAEENPHDIWPILIHNGMTIVETVVLVEYIDDVFNTSIRLLGKNRHERTMIRSMESWFCRKFYKEVIETVVYERLYKSSLFFHTVTDSDRIRNGLQALISHCEVLENHLAESSFLVGSEITVADLSAAAFISCLDFLNCIQWSKWPELKHWYYRIKSRPSFQPLLIDILPNVTPPAHYSMLDF